MLHLYRSLARCEGQQIPSPSCNAIDCREPSPLNCGCCDARPLASLTRPPCLHPALHWVHCQTDYNLQPSNPFQSDELVTSAFIHARPISPRYTMAATAPGKFVKEVPIKHSTLCCRIHTMTLYGTP